MKYSKSGKPAWVKPLYTATLAALMSYTTAAQAESLDAVFVVDESGSMGGEQAFLSELLPQLDAALISAGFTDNRFGLVGYSAFNRQRKHADLGSVAQFETARATLLNTSQSGTEDGYDGIDFVLNPNNASYTNGQNNGKTSFTFGGGGRTNVTGTIILVTDEDRDNSNRAVNYESIANLLNANNISLSGILNQSIRDDMNNAALAGNANNISYLKDGTNVTESQGVNLSDSNTKRQYADLILGQPNSATDPQNQVALLNPGCVADLNLLRNGGDFTAAFAQAFVSCISIVSQNQQDVDFTFVRDAETETQEELGMVLEPLRLVTNFDNVDHDNDPNTDPVEVSEEVETVVRELRKKLPRRAIQIALERMSGQQNADGNSRRGSQATRSQGRSVGKRQKKRREGGKRAGGFDINSVSVINAFGEVQSLRSLLQDNAGSITGGAASADQSDALKSGKMGIFVSGVLESGHSDPEASATGSDFHVAGLTAGVDYQLDDNTLVGASLGYNTTETDIDANGGRQDSDSTSLSVFATRTFDNGVFLDGSLTWSDSDYDAVRNIIVGDTLIATATSNTDGDQVGAQVRLGKAYDTGDWTLEPSATLSYTKVDVDGFTETGAGGLNLVVGSSSDKSLILSLGVEASTSFIATDNVLFTPRVRASFEHEFEDDVTQITTRFTDPALAGSSFEVSGSAPDRNYIRLGAGFEAVTKKDVKFSFDVDTVAGHDQLSDYWTVSANINIPF